MSVQFGRWNIDGQPVDEGYLEQVALSLAQYGPDGQSRFVKQNLATLYCAFHATTESRREVQPCLLQGGDVVTWDGRLDNRLALVGDLGGSLTSQATDLEIVVAAYERWGSDCFARLLGDWAFVAWNGHSGTLMLARDFAGIRPLYYSIHKNAISWSSVLDPLVLFAGRQFRLSEEYVAGWFSFFPATNLTPYDGIHSVPPCSFVRLRAAEHTVKQFWDFNPEHQILYRLPADYDHHFRTVFREAVQRRLRSATPVFAQLSGGMDSGSIVCMGDSIVDGGCAETDRLETLSFFDDSEPHSNERPYVAKIEERRGRPGFHIDVTGQRLFAFENGQNFFHATPVHIVNYSSNCESQTARIMQLQNSRVLLSGIGGDEVTGGVCTPIPELQDLMANLQLRELAHRLKIWALDKKVPWIHLFLEAVRDFISPTLKRQRAAPWLDPRFTKRQRATFAGYEKRLKLFGPLPSFQTNLMTLQALRRQIACHEVGCRAPYQTRYPYLDRSLLEFLYSIPRTQITGPGRRRLLMRRALKGIVPDAILERRRKGFVARGPTIALSSEVDPFSRLAEHMRLAKFGFLQPATFIATLQKAGRHEEVPLTHLIRTIFIEGWLTHLEERGVLASGVSLANTLDRLQVGIA